jgi:hypothetical protein
VKVTQLKRFFGYFFSTLLLLNIVFVSLHTSKQIGLNKTTPSDSLKIGEKNQLDHFALKAIEEKDGSETKESFVDGLQPLIYSVSSFYNFFKFARTKNELSTSRNEKDASSKLPYYLIYQDFRL